MSLGIHHVTAIATDPQRNLDFYVGVLGLRLVKRTVNFDDPSAYHFYYGDALGRPGTLVTFFTWPHAPPGETGTGMAAEVSFAIGPTSVPFWLERLRDHGIEHDIPELRFGEVTIRLRDPDGLQLSLVAHPVAEEPTPRADGTVPARHSIAGIHGVILEENDLDRTIDLLTGVLGFHSTASDGDLRRLEITSAELGTIVHVRRHLRTSPGRVGAGSIHHVAWRTPDSSTQDRARVTLLSRGLQVTAPLDRRYFRSIYFREPGGVLFEIATDPPGFTVDEPITALGQELQLPPWLEDRRDLIERHLPPVRVPSLDA